MTVEFKVEQQILQCVDDGLQALGNEGKKAVYYYLEESFGLNKQEIPKKPKIFWKGLNSIFGKEGASLIERWITEKLKMSFNLKRISKVTFTEIVTIIAAKQNNR